MTAPGPAGPKGDRGKTGPRLPKGVARAVVVLFFASFILAAGSLWLATQQIAASNHRWCATLTLLTARPVPKPANPRANPSRENSYIFYADILDLRHRFGCG